jgi:CubicO group peptidase (beta-lactamase class C family)
MPGQPDSRSLPGHPSLRYLKLEAKRRVAAGEFPSLHEAQVAIAREHGLPSWAALKQQIGEDQDSHALDQLRWVISRFAGADQPDWTAPAADELNEHFDDRFLAALPPPVLIEAISKAAADLREGEPVVLDQTPVQAYVELNGVQYLAVVEAEPPHRLTGLRGVPTGRRVRDSRVTGPVPVRVEGEVPAEVADLAAQAFAELGLTALLMAGGDARTPTWVLTQGWADLDRGEPLEGGHRFPVPGATVLVTATAVLALVADGRISLDDRANDQLRSIRLADDTITVRELLSHTAGVDSPSSTEMFADAVPELKDLMGPVIACTGPRGTVAPSNGGCAVLGQLVTDVTGLPYPEAAARLVLDPLDLTDSSFPAHAADIGSRAVTGYSLTLEGRFEPVPARIPTLQAVAGLWSTGADLVRLGLGWSSLLPEALAHEALTPQTGPGPGGSSGIRVGLGWLLSPRGDIATHAGANVDGTAAITSRVRDQRTHVVLTSRMIPVNSIETRLLRAWTNPALTTKNGEPPCTIRTRPAPRCQSSVNRPSRPRSSTP